MDPLDHDDPSSVAGYRLLGRLGAGGMGRVYLALSPGGRQVAVKVVRPDLADDAGFRERFAREVAAARLVSGVFTAPVLDADPLADPPWLVTGYIPGPSLDKAVEQFGPLPVPSCELLAAGLAEALAAIHAAGLVHRDLKPSNVLLAADGPRVIDFGIVRAVHDSGLTRAGALIGTPAFMSPEQVQGLDVGPAGDVFALGAVVAYAATGHRPFGADSVSAILYRVVNEEPDLSSVPGQLLPLVQACLSKDPQSRPSPADLLRGLQQAVGLLATGTDWLPQPLSASVGQRIPAAVPQPRAAETQVPKNETQVPKKRRKLPIIGGVAALLFGGIVAVSIAANQGDDGGGTALCSGTNENFASGALEPWKLTPGGFLASEEISGGKVKLLVKNGARLADEQTAPTISYQIHSDFTFETTVEVAPKFTYQSVGIFLAADSDNYVGLERGFDNFGGIAFLYGVKGKEEIPHPLFDQAGSEPIKTDATTVGLRLVRSGADITGYWRPGTSGAWQTVGKVSGLPDGLSAVFAAQNKATEPSPDPAKAPLAVSLDKLHVTC